MTARHFLMVGALGALAATAGGCDPLEMGEHPGPDEAPSAQQLQQIAYMSSVDSGAKGRKVYTRPEEAKTCSDFELAMRWNRPPGVEGGPFHQKMVYLSATLPADLPRNTEVFLSATIQEGETLPSGSQRWYLRMKDGTLVEAIEDAGFMEKQESASQEQGNEPGRRLALVDPNMPHRAFCGHGIYQGVAGKQPQQEDKIPLVSVLFAMDRKK